MNLKARAFFCVFVLVPIFDGCKEGGNLNPSNSGVSFSSELYPVLTKLFVDNTNNSEFAFSTNGVKFNGSISIINSCFNPTAIEVNGQRKIFDNVRCGVGEYYSSRDGEIVERGEFYFLTAFKRSDESIEYVYFDFPDYFPTSSVVYFSPFNFMPSSQYVIVSSVAYYRAFDVNEIFSVTDGTLTSKFNDGKFSISFPSISYTNSNQSFIIKGSLACCEQ